MDKSLRDCALQDGPAARQLVEQIRAFKFCLQVVQRARELVRDDRARFRALQSLVFAPEAHKLSRCVFRNFRLNVFDVTLVELARLAILEHHEVHVFFRGQCETSEDFE